METSSDKTYARRAWVYLALGIAFYTTARFLSKDSTLGLAIGTALEIGSFVLLPFIAIFFIRAWRNKKRTSPVVTTIPTADSKPQGNYSEERHSKRFRLNQSTIIIVIALVIAAVIFGIPQYTKYQEQSARRECAEQIVQKKQELKQARTEWDRKCDEAKRINNPTFPIAVSIIERSCKALYGPKPPEGDLSIDEERKLISLCLERKGFDE